MSVRARLLSVLTVLLVLPALLAVGPVAAQGGGLFDGDPVTTQRIAAEDPVQAAIEVSQARFGSASHAVLATVETFADSLAGAALTADGPLLLTASGTLTPATLEELQRVLPAGGGVYVLGGEAAIAPAVVEALEGQGWDTTRLAGQSRVETALAVADEVLRRDPGDTVLLARADGAAGNPTSAWADSMTGGSLAAAAGLPIIVTPTEAVHPAVAEWLAANAPARTVLLGGEAALSEAVAGAVPGPTRLAGAERTATAAAIAESPLWPRADARRFVILDGARADGWAYGLSAAGIAADHGAPPLLVSDRVTAATRRLVSTCGAPEVDLLLVGGPTVIAPEIEDILTGHDGGSCAGGFAALQQFADCTQTLEYFVAEGLQRVGPYGLDGYWYGAEVVVDDTVEDDGAGPPPPAPSAPGEGSDDEGVGGGAEEGDAVSGTNTQEEGVDEPDIVKTNGQAAYVASYGAVEVVDLTGDAPVHARQLDLPVQAFANELLLHEDVLVVLTAGDGFAHPPVPEPAGTTFAPEQYYPEPVTHVTRFDISDPTDPVRLDTAAYDGSYRSARMVDGIVRLVASSNPTGLDFVFPSDDSTQAHDAALAHNREVITESVITDWLPSVSSGGAEALAVDCSAVFAPPGFSGIATATVAAIDASVSASPTSSAAVVAQAETLYASTERLVLTSSRWGLWTDEVPQAVTTEVHSFDIADPTATRYVASGQVEGYVLNSFAMSERDGYYRIATTTEPPWTPDQPAGVTDNGITVLTEGGGELFTVGRVVGLGAGERIFAVRYLGDLAAVVTFQQIDPLYLVDLTDPAAPRVTGELKIPGVSRYLHPLGPDHLLGVGQDGTDDGRLTGVQVSLFDIGDRANPTRVDSLEFGPGSSPVEFDHKAFLYWAPLGRAFVPTDLYAIDEYGAKAIDIDVAAGSLDLAGTLVQPRPDGYGQPVQRTFVVADTVYAVGHGGISAHDLTTLADQGFAPFPPGETCCQDQPAPPPEGGTDTGG
ncbi:MAG TPA: beta-propeller domain-containing protein [Euzebya sp.]|nr:beta-propeller domain-containing protein [Euzebya sp.]